MKRGAVNILCRQASALWGAAAVALLAMASCSTSECYENSTSLPYAGFYDLSPVPKPMQISGVKVVGVDAPGDSVLLAPSETAISKLYLPFRLDSDTTAYVFTYTGIALPDTVTFIYSRQPWFVSEACGAVVNFVIRDIRHTSVLIDSVSCPSGVITNANKENIRIFFNTIAEEE